MHLSCLLWVSYFSLSCTTCARKWPNLPLHNCWTALFMFIIFTDLVSVDTPFFMPRFLTNLAYTSNDWNENEVKTHIAHLSRGVKFLGVEIFTRYIKIQDKKVVAFKKKVKVITKRNSGGNLTSMILELNRLLRGFVNYYKVANCKGVLTILMSWIRRRLRAKQMKLWKKPAKMHRRLRQLGYKGEFSCIKMSSWCNAGCQLAHMAMPNQWFEEMKLHQLDKVQVGVLPEINR